ncbi:MAG: hypothetical protein IJG25_04145 [Thermoguttaceae bacterium]|nr:hypothetical protein [Thermoguttaceae bacterium]
MAPTSMVSSSSWSSKLIAPAAHLVAQMPQRPVLNFRQCSASMTGRAGTACGNGI